MEKKIARPCERATWEQVSQNIISLIILIFGELTWRNNFDRFKKATTPAIRNTRNIGTYAKKDFRRKKRKLAAEIFQLWWWELPYIAVF